jgi:phage protein D
MPETPTTDQALYRARPTLRLQGQEHSRLRELVVAMEMQEQEGGLSSLELRFTNVASLVDGDAELAFEDDALLKLGAAIGVYAGDETAPQEIFRGWISALEGEFPENDAPQLVVLAEDGLQRGRMLRRTAVHEGGSIAAIVRELAPGLGLNPVVNGFTAPIGPQVQLDESDLAFLRRLLRRHDGDLQVVGADLQVTPRAESRRGELELRLHGQLRRARILADLAHQHTEISVGGWDPALGQRVLARSSGMHRGPGQGRSGAQVLERTLGQRSHHIAHLAASSAGEAQALADAAFDADARRFLCVEGTAEGNPALRVGTHLRLTGLGERFDNVYVVSRSCHRFDLRRGYETDFEAECGYWGGNR